MKLFKKSLAAALAAGLLHLSFAPAVSAASQAMPGVPGGIGTGIVIKTVVPTGPAVVPGTGVYGPSSLPAIMPAGSHAADLLGAATAPEVPGSQSLLTQMGELAGQTHEKPSAAGEIGRAYTGEAQRHGVTGDLPSVGSGSGPADSGLRPSAPAPLKAASETPAPAKPSRFNSFTAKVHPAVWIGLAAVLVIGIIIGVVKHNADKRNEMWQNSKSNQAIVLVEKERRAGNADALDRIASEAAARQKSLQEAIAHARSAGSKTVQVDGKEMSLKDAEFYTRADGLVIARAELNENAVSKDPSKRIGEQLPPTWQQNIANLEGQAKQTAFEGSLSLELKKLQAEQGRQDGHAGRIQGAIKDFEDNVPGLFGGRLKEMGQRAEADLNEFNASERNTETALLDRAVSEMRGRISSRLAQGDGEYRAIQQHREALAELANGTLRASVELARSVDKDLADISARLKDRTAALKEAENHRKNADKAAEEAVRLERVEVKVPAVDKDGKPITDADGNPLYTIKIEDQSGPKKQEAANERQAADEAAERARRAADQARGLSISANRSIESLSTMIAALHRDRVIQSENLDPALPQSLPRLRVYAGYYWVELENADLAFFLNQLSETQYEELRAKFGGVVGPLETTLNTVNQRRDSDTRKLETRINQELANQEAKAKSGGF